MPTELKLQDPGSFRALVSNNALCDPAVGPDLPGATVAADQSFGGGVLAVNVHGDLSLRAFNSPDDMDDDGILGEMEAPVPVDGLPPQIELTPGTACLKYRAAAG